MKRSSFAIVVLLCLSGLLPAQITIQGGKGTQAQKAVPANGPLTNADVIRMFKANLAESTILLAIDQRPACAFDTTPDALIELKNVGVPQAIMDAMLRKSAQPSLSGSSTGAPSATVAPPRRP